MLEQSFLNIILNIFCHDSSQVTLSSSVVTVCVTCFNIQKLCIFPTHYMYVFHVILRINSDCYPKQH
jgi:hypothetical protein